MQLDLKKENEKEVK